MKPDPAALLAWYDRARRDLPWRKTRDPYAVWVSEIMLQQTQVKTVLPYYGRFLKRFPTVEILAAAPLDDVLTLWAGLGYYRRAEHLHAAAKRIVSAHRGKVPKTFSALQGLPGVGRSTAAAIASIAFGEPVAVLDGNVVRVLCRLFNIEEEPSRPAARSKLWDLAQELVPAVRPGDYNSALMELGATVCTPATPSCRACPVNQWCGADQAGNPERLPLKRRQPKPRVMRRQVFVIWAGARVLLLKRPARGLWAGLWEFPSFAPLARKGGPAAWSQALREQLGLEVKLASKPIALRHQLSHRTVVGQVFTGQCRESGLVRVKLPACDSERYRAFRWVKPSRLGHLPISALTRKIAAAAGIISR